MPLHHSPIIKSSCLLAALLYFTSINAQSSAVELKSTDGAYVFLQLKPQDTKKDSMERQQEIKSLVDQVKAANERLGYKSMEKKIATFAYTDNGKSTTYLTIRPFDEIGSAITYAAQLKKELKPGLYGKIDQPIPIEVTKYKQCLSEKDFITYANTYTATNK